MSDPIHLLLDLFATVPNVMVCVKDGDGRYVGANDAFVRRARRRRADQVIGRIAADLFPAGLAASYEAQDRAVFLTGTPVRNQFEVITDLDGNASGTSRWYLTTKVLGDSTQHGAVVVATSVDAQFGDRSGAATGLRAAIELAHQHGAGSLRVADLAAAAAMSTDRLERAMGRVLGTSPKQYLLRLRAERAAMLLATTDRSVAHIAAECGYSDQSQMTRQFRDHIGTTPSGYRAAVP